MPETIRKPRVKSASSLKHEMVRRDGIEKWERSLFTNHGVKIVRLQPSINNRSIAKYQSRSRTDSSNSTSPRLTSTPKASPYSPSPPPSRSQSAKDRFVSPKTRTMGTQTSLSRASSAGLVREKPPGPVSRPSSSNSNHSHTFTARSASCRPPSMYRNESLRTAAKLNRPPSHVHECEYRADSRRSQAVASREDCRTPSRFDGTPVDLPAFMSGNEFMCHEDLDLGQKQYIWGIARVYSVSHLMDLKQRQYQSLLDYEFSRRIQNKELKEHERVREWKEYQRYCRFIKRYEQRIPRSRKDREESPCQELNHIHRHMIKGWTTNANANDAYRPAGECDQRYAEEDRCHTSTSGDTSDTITGQYELRMRVLKNAKHAREDTPDKTESEDAKSDGKSSIENQSEEVLEELGESEGNNPEEREQFTDNELNVL